ncbi:MAG TPA: ATP-binding protein [Thermomicrobiales bacterium]|jgi:PAS domain S-box-containing protein
MTPLNVLLLEDRATDAEMVLHELRRSGFAPAGARVDSEADYLAALRPDLDVILADYSLRRFDAPRALALLQERKYDVPFIVVTGTIGEELAVAAIRQGATDYLLKDRLRRLGECVRAALEQRRLRSEKQRAEAALRAREEQYRSLVANIPDVTWRADETGAHIFVSPNAERILGLTPEAICEGGTASWLGRIHPDDAGCVHTAYTELFSTHEPFDVDYRFQRGDGRWIWLHDRAEAVEERDGILYADGASTDITTRKQTEEALRRAKDAAEAANRMKSEFLSTVSHELRTPLTTIIGFGQLLQRGRDGELSTRQAAQLDRIMGSANHLLELIDDLLDLAKIEAGRMEITPAVVDVSPLLARVLSEFVPQAEAKGLSLVLDVPAEVPPVLADPMRTRQILLNLVANAIKFTACGAVTLAARVDGSEVVVTVADTGIGIDPEALDYIFDEFRRVEEGFTRRFSGAGLGLPIARKLATLQAGTIAATSQPGAGSTFTLRLPRADAAPPDDHLVRIGHAPLDPPRDGRGNGSARR